MSSLRFTGRFALASFVMALVSATAQAAVVANIGAQAPKVDLTDATVPTANMAVAGALAAFNAHVAPLGGNEFEPVGNVDPTLGFSYGSGSASFTGMPVVAGDGGVRIQDGSTANPLLGRYNMSPGVPPNSSTGFPGEGNWVEASRNFEIAFSQAISAFSFFATDLGDFGGTAFLDLWDGNTLIAHQELRNDEKGPQFVNPNDPVDPSLTVETGNGNLLYVGMTSSGGQTFNRAVFSITQCGAVSATCSGNSDVLGFDSFVVGNYIDIVGTPVPEPTSLALVGLALCAAGWSRKSQRAA